MKYLSISLICMTTLFAACNHSNNSDEGSVKYAKIESEAPETKRDDFNKEETTEQSALQAYSERKLIKNGRIRFETDNLSDTHSKIENALKKYQGYISADQESKQYNSINHFLEVRIPAANFDLFLVDISTGIAHFDERSINVQDVTEQYMDLDARISSKKELEKRFLELLQKANSVAEILEIEKEISELRSNIETMEGRLRLMKNQISLSTLYIEYYIQQTEQTRGFGFKFRNGFKNGWENFLGFFIILANAWPFVLVVIIAILFVRRRLRKRKS